MTTGLTLHHLFTSSETDQFLVPEIQRDYVWGTLQLDKLLGSLRATFSKAQRQLDLQVSGTDASTSVVNSFLEHHRRQRSSHHMGFIYAYHDSAYVGKAFLIDGQQRLLSLYLLLLARAVQENEQGNFRTNYLTATGKIKLDYRVRAATHDFLQRFVSFVLTASSDKASGGPAIKAAIKQQYWYLQAYEQDPTISHILDNFTYLVGQPQELGPDYHFLQHYVRFWYFDTGDSARGEDLYLSLNSTGLITSTGENQRALLLSMETDPDLKQVWGLQLEKWQDFFWKHRGSNLNADQGFNEFFRWLRILAPALTGSQAGVAALIGQALQKTDTPRELPLGFTLNNAARLMEVLRFLFPLPNSTTISNVPAALLPFSWLGPTGSLESARLGNRDLFRLLPVLAYCMERVKQPQDDKWEHLTRVARYFYNVHRLSRIAQAGVSELADFCAEAILLAQELGATATGDITGLIDISASRKVPLALLPPEEKQKLLRYQLAGSERPEMERLLNQLEDDTYNQGQVGHLFVGESLATASLETMQRIYQRYFALGLDQPSNKRILQSLLLLWGDCTVQDRESYLFEQYNYGDWSDIIRNTDGGFHAFFSDFLQQNLDVASYYKQNKQRYYETKTTGELLADSSFDNQLRLLALLLEYFQSLEPESDNISLWPKGQQIGYFYPDHIEGRDYDLPDDQAIFGDQTLRFWNVSNRLTSASHKVIALLPWAYELYKKHNPQALSYRQFMEARLEEVGVRVETDVVSNHSLPLS